MFKNSWNTTKVSFLITNWLGLELISDIFINSNLLAYIEN